MTTITTTAMIEKAEALMEQVAKFEGIAKAETDYDDAVMNYRWARMDAERANHLVEAALEFNGWHRDSGRRKPRNYEKLITLSVNTSVKARALRAKIADMEAELAKALAA